MIARALGALALIASVGWATPWTVPGPAESSAEPVTAIAINPEQSVQDAFAQVLPDQPMRFALESAQSTWVEGGGRRFDGTGIGAWADGDARFVAFTMTLSARGELVEFDYQTQGSSDRDDPLGAR